MPEPRRRRLDRAAILSAAVEISLSSEDHEPQSVTGATLGSHLGVDRSAVWRHFADKQELLFALNDRLLLPIVEAAGAETDPDDRLAAVFDGFVDAYRRHPLLAQELLGVSPLGENWRRLAELVVTALGDLGLGPRTSAQYFRMFMELTTSYASSLAAFVNRPLAEREREAAAAQLDLMSIDAGRFPHLAETAPFLSSVSQQEVSQYVIQSLRFARERSGD